MKFKILMIMGLFFFFFGCKDYVVKDHKVYYKTWNENHGTRLQLVDNVDVASFKSIKKGYGKDKDHLFYNGKLIENSDPASLKILKQGYATDKNQAYYYGRPFSSDTDIVFLKKPYVKTSKNIFYKGKLLENCNPQTFKILHQSKFEIDNWATDGRYYFFNNYRIPSENYDDFVYFENSRYSKDKEFVFDGDGRMNYKDGVKIFDIDVASFGVKENGDYFDKDGVFTYYERTHPKE